MAEEKRYQGELTLVKIQDGIDGAGLDAVYDFYYLSSTSTVPEVPATTYQDGGVERLTTVEWIEQNSPWRRQMPEGLGKDNPYVWNFRRTEYGSKKVEHSAAVIASFWATAPEVMARYSANQNPPWDKDYDETKHNFILFSYDDGTTWSPVTSGTTLEDIVGGIRIKGRVEVDEEAITYAINSSQNEILFYNDIETNDIVVSPKIITFQIQKQYLGITEVVNLAETGDKAAQIYQPTLTCELVTYSEPDSPIDLTSIIASLATTDNPILTYDYQTDTIKLDFEYFYNEVTEEQYKENPDPVISRIGTIFIGMESFLRVKIALATPEDVFTLQQKYSVRFASSYDLARLSVHANGITQSIRNTKLVFDSEGLTVRNGGIRIYKTAYVKDLTVTSETDFTKTAYYIETEEGYQRQTSYIEGLVYYRESTGESTKIFEVDGFGNLRLIGNGVFSGTVYAENGEFSGRIKATSGYLENLLINGELTVQGSENVGHGIKIRGMYKRSQEAYDSSKSYYYYDEEEESFMPYIEAPGAAQLTLFEKTDRPGIISTNFCIDEANRPDEGFYLDPVEGKIWASSIVLGNGAFINDKIVLAYEETGERGEICNPARYEGVFIQAFDSNNRSVLKMNTGGKIYVGPHGVSGENYVVINGPKGAIHSGNFQSGSKGWRINNLNAEFNNIIARGTLKTAVFEYEKVSAIGGIVLVRPSALIDEATFVDGSNNTQVTLVLETQQIMFRESTTDPATDYFFRIGTNDAVNIGSGATTGGVHIRGKEAYVLVSESEISFGEDSEKTVVIKKASGKVFTEEDLASFSGGVLIGYGEKGDIGIGLNSQNASTALPPEAISIFQTDTIVNEDTGEVELYETPRIILGKIREGDEEKYGLTGYGLYADNVNVKGELTSLTDKYYSGINSNSTVFEKEGEQGSQIILWAGANIENLTERREFVAKIQEAPFRVNLDGTVHATKGYFSGEIYGSTITASTLRATVIEGYDLDKKEVAALSIRNALKGIEFSSIDENNIKKVYMELLQSLMTVNVKLEANEGIKTTSLSITNNLAINDSLVRFAPGITDSSAMGILYKESVSDWNNKEITPTEIAYFANDGFYSKKVTHLDGDIFFGEQSMEYKKVYRDGTSIQIGYDLYIKS